MHFYLFFPAETVSTSPARRLWASADQDTFQSFESYATPTGAAKGSIGAGSTTDAEDLTDEGVELILDASRHVARGIVERTRGARVVLLDEMSESMDVLNNVSTVIATDTDTFIRQRHEEIFLDVVKNNRLVFEAVDGWLALQPEPTQLKYALPLPILGELCGPSSSDTERILIQRVFLKKHDLSRQPLVEQKQKALRSRAKSGRVEQLSVWTKNESKTALAISKRANRVAFGALLFTILGVAVDAAANLVTILTTKRDMAEVEDEAAQVFAQSRQDRREA
eukprot:g20194.t1